ncbi:MAG: exonuclease domain-containing protein [Ruminococcaceae bacterium]|nr:exonuclease domain-containing protein [Oscillospiraceae bacterium]
MTQFVILDLEWNTAYSRSKERFINEIIEFGAVKLDDELNVIDSFSSLVKPKIEKKLRSRVKNLTNISNQDVAEADGFLIVFERFLEWLDDGEEIMLMSWGDMDIRTLIDNCVYYYDNPRIPLVSKYFDLQSYFMLKKNLAKGQQISLSNAATLIEVDADKYTHHRALGDSELAAVCFRAVFDENDYLKYVLTCDDEFYERILFKPYIVTDINDILVDKTVLSCRCTECGMLANQTSDWKFVNNNFRAFYFCKSCKVRYRVQVQFKKAYTQLNIKKSVIKIENKVNKK